jgi:hypothetical protein
LDLPDGVPLVDGPLGRIRKIIQEYDPATRSPAARDLPRYRP